MQQEKIILIDTDYRKKWKVEVRNDEGELLTEGQFGYINTRYGNTYVKTLTAAGIGTPVEHRRHGLVRKIFMEAIDNAVKDGAAISMIHPFSFAYYEKFGYGKTGDHIVVRCPISRIDFVDRCPDLVRYRGTEQQVQDLVALYDEFSKGRNMLRQRTDAEYFEKKNPIIYMYYEDGKATGYISFTTEKTMVEHHFEDGVMRVREVAYTTLKALHSILGFIRMYEGELDDVEFANLSICPEIEMALRHYTHTSYRSIADLAVRVLNTEVMLSSHAYPMAQGAFRIEVTDPLGYAAGKFAVEYKDGKGEVRRLNEEDAVDLRTDVSTFSRLIYGYDALNAHTASFVKTIEILGDAGGFFAAFPKAVGGVWELF